MNTLATIAIIVAALGFIAWLASHPRGFRLHGLANIAEGRYPGKKSYYTDAALAARYLLCKTGSDAAHIAITGVGDIPLGVCTDEAAAAEELVNLDFLGMGHETKLMVASAAIAKDDLLVAAANGKVRTLPVAAGTYYIIGRAIKLAAADGDLVEVVPSFPIQRVVP